MKRSSISSFWANNPFWLLVTLVLALSGCGGGSGGSQGPAGPPGPGGPPGTQPPSAKSLNIVINSVTINSPPVVEFTVTNENGYAFPGLTGNDLRFNIAKLITGSNGDPSTWQNYIVRASGGAMQGSQERLRSGYPFGSLADHGDGTYTYTFATDLTTVSASCPAPCTTADNKPLDLTYVPTLTHRVGIQQANSSLPSANALCDVVPANGTQCVDPASGSITSREIVKTANCNSCHDKITAHGSRFEVRLCVTCHNPGSWVDANTPVDFKVMIHKIHRSPSISGVGQLPHNDYAVGNHDFADVVFPQDTRNCTKCHDGSDPETPQGNNWQIVPSIAACGSCHDDIDFTKDGTVDPTGHPEGPQTDNSQCVTCHSATGTAGTVASSHTVPGKAERAFFQYNILEICDVAVGTKPGPVCPPNTPVKVKFSVTDPTGATHGFGSAYKIRPAASADPEYSSATSTAARLTLDMAWDTRDYTNLDGTGARPARADNVNLLTSTDVVDNGDGTYTFTGTATAGLVPATASGSGAVGIEGRAAADDGTGKFTVRVPVNSPVDYFAITDSSPVPRRRVVDAATKCDRCHDVLSAHGGSRNNNGQLCVMCHNSSNTDVSNRKKDAVTGLPLIDPLDGKTEESIDFKRMIHGIHAASATNFDGTDAHGFRTKGLVVSGTDFSDLRFPGVLSKCHTCHLEKGELGGTVKYDTYVLEDHTADGGPNWELPAQNGIRGSTVNSYPNAKADGTDFAAQLTLQSDDLKFSPIASVCSACHDGTLERAHMEDNSGVNRPLDAATGRTDGENQAFMAGNVEACPVCHGAGKYVDVELVHDDAFARFLGDFIP